MMKPRQPSLALANPDPAEIVECVGAELLTLNERAKADGKSIVRLDVRGVARYRAHLRSRAFVDAHLGHMS